jgi:D-alanine-D-alanine ligase
MERKHARIAILYARSEDTPWQENVDDLTVDTILRHLPGDADHGVFRFTGFDTSLLKALSGYDLVFNLCYGYGEIDQVQVAEWLTKNGLPHTGSLPGPMRLAQDKATLPFLCRAVGVETPPLLEDVDDLADDELYVRKPRYGSCHRGVIVGTGAMLRQSRLSADAEHLLQPYLPGREFSVAVIPGPGGTGRVCLPPVELKPDDGSPVFVPGRGPYQTLRDFDPGLTGRLRERLMRDALALHHAMGLAAMSRTDFRLDTQGTVQALDVNALPNLHPFRSLMPSICSHAGIGIPELLDRVVASSIHASDRRLASPTEA